MSQGARAGKTGNALESVIKLSLERNGYTFVERSKFDAARYLDQPIYSMQYPIGKSIYNTQLYCDFIMYHPQKHPDCLVIESKWQQSGGSVDEKFPYLVVNIRDQYPCATVIVVDGGGCRASAVKWLKEQEDQKKLSHVFNMMEFQKWSNSEEF